MLKAIICEEVQNKRGHGEVVCQSVWLIEDTGNIPDVLKFWDFVGTTKYAKLCCVSSQTEKWSHPQELTRQAWQAFVAIPENDKRIREWVTDRDKEPE